MKRILLPLACLLLGASAAQAEKGISLTTSASVGTEIKFLVNAKSATQPVVVDFGDGEATNFTISPTQWASNRWITGTVKGENIRVSGNVTEFMCEGMDLTKVSIEGMTDLTKLELGNNKIVDFEFVDESPVEYLDLSNNKLENYVSYNNDLTLEKVGKTLTNLNVSNNSDLRCLYMANLEVIEYLSAHDCPELNTIYICAPEEEQSTLLSIDLSNCDIAHFYPVSLPALRTLKLANNSLSSSIYDTDPFELGNYPALTLLDVSGNFGVMDLDVTGCSKLEELNTANCLIGTIDLSQNAELLSINVANNLLSSIDLGANNALTSINVSGNENLAAIDLAGKNKLMTLDISGTAISRVDLYDCYFLKSFVGSKSALEFVDFNSQQPDQMILIDLRDCPNFTPMSMAYTIQTLPVARNNNSTGINLYLAGSHPEISNIAYVTGQDMHWRCDSEGDASATFPEMEVTVANATLTDDRVKGTLDRLYPYGGIGLTYDLGVYEAAEGKFLLAQWQPEYFQTIKSVEGEIRQGVPTYVYTYPAEGKKFRSVTVNGKEIFSPWFIVNSDKNTIEVNFQDAESSVVLGTENGRALSFCVSTNEGGLIEIDWGTGSRTPYSDIAVYQSGNYDFVGTRVDGTAAGDYVTIYGDIAGVDVSCFGEVGEEMFGLPDNHITTIDVTGCSALKMLNLYWNPIKELDLSRNRELERLDFSYTAIESIDLSHNPALISLTGYANSDELGANFTQISSINLAGLEALEDVDLHNQNLTTIDLSGAPSLMSLNLNNNALTSLDLSANTELSVLRISGNKLTAIDLSKNPELVELLIDGNNLESIDFSGNLYLEEVSVANNLLKTLDTGMLENLGKLSINGNGLSAEQLNTIYYLLPLRKARPADDDQMSVKYNLIVNQGGDRAANDGEGADGSLAVARAWNPTPLGTNSGSPTAYIDIEAAQNGTFVVKDAEGTVLKSGDTVKKYVTLSVEATPAEGYKFDGFRLNGEDLSTENTFTMPGIYTVVEPVFSPLSGIADVAGQNGFDAYVDAAGLIIVEGPDAAVTVYGVDGRVVAEGTIAGGSVAIACPANGTFIVKVAGEGQTFVKKLAK